MPFGFEETRLWRQSLAPQLGSYTPQRTKLSSAYHNFRERAALVAGEIPLDLREYTVHDVTHLDALWELADQISGDDVVLTPTEAFVLGGAFLIHDLGMGLAAWPGGMAQLQQEPSWPDILATAISECTGRPVTEADLADPPEKALARAKETALRERHAFRAADLALISWQSQATGDTYSLIENVDLRERYGPLIGEIAASHWWDINKVAERFSASEPIGAPVDCPDDWTVDELKLACLMRVADAAHLDARRAPGFLRALRRPMGYSDYHWAFQGYLQRPQRSDDRLAYTSARAFNVKDAQAWWVCFESLQMVDRELRSVDSLLSDRGKPRFAVRGVKGAEEPARLADLIRTVGWMPVDARPKIDNVPELIRKLGGEGLYGPNCVVALRELIQNARDATQALKVILPDDPRPILVELSEDSSGEWWLTVSDHGVGMSQRVLSETLLDFGQSYWGSQLMRHETPGLGASGFTSIGRFGIGFYSVFMLGDEVRVTSRRYDEASSATKILEFSEGLALRPILRPASPDEVRHQGGTSVSVKLRLDPSDEDGLLNPSSRRLFSLRDVCAFIAPALDCDLETRFQSEGVERCISGDDWMHVPGEELLRRISEIDNYSRTFPNTRISLAEVADRLRPITVDGEVVVRATLAPIPPSAVDGPTTIATSSCVVIGGLRAGSDLGGITGVASGVATTVDRMKFALSIPARAWADWASTQADLWRDTLNESLASADYSEAGMAAGLIAHLGGDTRGIFVGRSDSGLMTIGEVQEWARSRERVNLFNDFAVDVQAGKGGSLQLWHREKHVRIELADSTLLSLASSARYGSWDHYGSSTPDQRYASEAASAGQDRLSARAWYHLEQRSLDASLLRAVADAWSQDLDTLLESLEGFDRVWNPAVIGRDEEGLERTSPFMVWAAERR